MNTRVVSKCRAELGEGPLWDAGRGCLWYVDIMRGHVHRCDPDSGDDRIYEMGQPVGAVAIAKAGDLICAVRDGFVRLDPGTARVTHVADVETDLPRNRMNDGYVDARGRFWAGTMSMDGVRNAGALYCLAPDGSVTQHLTGVTTSNGVDWSADNTTMFYIDTGERRVDRFDFDLERGAIANRRTFVEIDPRDGKPDGLVIDADDHIWVALWHGAQVRRYSPAGDVVTTITLPTPLTTKPAFGGPHLTDLFVTSAFIQLNDAERAASPDAGALFHIEPGVRGRNPRVFG